MPVVRKTFYYCKSRAAICTINKRIIQSLRILPEIIQAIGTNSYVRTNFGDLFFITFAIDYIKTMVAIYGFLSDFDGFYL